MQGLHMSRQKYMAYILVYKNTYIVGAGSHAVASLYEVTEISGTMLLPAAGMNGNSCLLPSTDEIKINLRYCRYCLMEVS